jgi:excinuclease ABC subunit C
MAEPDAAAFQPETLLARLPARPGVYRMIDAQGGVLYVGKARHLKNRVTSYFRASGLTTKTMSMVGKIADIQITVTASETEALLLEQSLIKEFRPPYNVTLRDDKSYPYIYLTDHADYPRLSFHRGAKRRGGRYFGPFPSASAVRESINILQKLFQLRSCEDSYFKNRSRPCLQHQIGRCTAPCVGLIAPADYAADVRRAELFLDGRSQEVLAEFKQEMERAAEALDFERAARYRDQITQLRKVQEQQYVHAESGDVDVFAIACASALACVQGLFIRGGRLLGHRNWFPRNELGLEPAELLEAFLSQYYLGSMERDMPRSVIVSEALDGADVLANALTEAGKRRVDVTGRVRAQRARWLELARENAELSLSSYLADKQNVYARFIALQDALGFEDTPQRLECFDISHSSGEATVASCVVFDQNGPLKSDYRRFNIEGVGAGDDYGAMHQALRRRYQRLKSGEGALPDLLVIDGGQGQVREAQQVLQDLQVEGVQILGIAKGTTRKPGLETLYLAGQGEVVLPPQGAAMHLLQHIRDEAHRFAVTGHRQRRDKARRVSELDAIPGIGPKRKRELLRHFGSLAGVQGASAEEIAKLPGINRKLAEEIYGHLHPL